MMDCRALFYRAAAVKINGLAAYERIDFSLFYVPKGRKP
jgi:hypothetical protein